jgi:hypothetical protein
MTSATHKMVKQEASKIKKARRNAQITYLLIIGAFLSVITVAVTTTMMMEQEKQRLPIFHQIKVTRPISLFDKTYLTPHPDSSH